MGTSATIGGFYTGYGYITIGILLLLSILLWLLPAVPNLRFMLVLGLFLLFLAIIEFIYFFPFAAAFSLLAGIFTLSAIKKTC